MNRKESLETLVQVGDSLGTLVHEIITTTSSYSSRVKMAFL